MGFDFNMGDCCCQPLQEDNCDTCIFELSTEQTLTVDDSALTVVDGLFCDPDKSGMVGTFPLSFVRVEGSNSSTICCAVFNSEPFSPDPCSGCAGMGAFTRYWVWYTAERGSVTEPFGFRAGVYSEDNFQTCNANQGQDGWSSGPLTACPTGSVSLSKLTRFGDKFAQCASEAAIDIVGNVTLTWNKG